MLGQKCIGQMRRCGPRRLPAGPLPTRADAGVDYGVLYTERSVRYHTALLADPPPNTPRASIRETLQKVQAVVRELKLQPHHLPTPMAEAVKNGLKLG